MENTKPRKGLFGRSFRLFRFALLVGGWTLAASALHVVRAPGVTAGVAKVPYVKEWTWPGRIVFIPKNTLSFRETFVDVRQWTPADAQQHARLTSRIMSAGKGDLLNHVAAGPIVQANLPIERPGFDSAKPSKPSKPSGEKSIFDIPDGKNDK